MCLTLVRVCLALAWVCRTLAGVRLTLAQEGREGQYPGAALAREHSARALEGERGDGKPVHLQDVVARRIGSSANRCVVLPQRSLGPLGPCSTCRTVTSKVSTGASKSLYQARPRIVAFF